LRARALARRSWQSRAPPSLRARAGGRAGERARCRACVLCVRLSVSSCNLQITKEEKKNREENPVAVAAVEHLSSSVIAQQELEEQERRRRA